MTLEHKIEALLFYKGEPVTLQELSEITNETEEAVKTAVETLQHSLESRGLRVIILEDKVELRTAPEISEMILNLEKEELSRPLGKAGSETLSIILYRGPVTRAEIDYIRGVNSTFILRNLLIRGLVEKVHNPKDQRSYLYKPTLDLLAHLGIKQIEELPDYESIVTELKTFEQVEENTDEFNDED